MTQLSNTGMVSWVLIPFGLYLLILKTPSWALMTPPCFDLFTILTAHFQSFPAFTSSCPLNFVFLRILSLVLFSSLLEIHHRQLYPSPCLQYPRSLLLAVTSVLSNKCKLPAASQTALPGCTEGIKDSGLVHVSYPYLPGRLSCDPPLHPTPIHLWYNCSLSKL